LQLTLGKDTLDPGLGGKEKENNRKKKQFYLLAKKEMNAIGGEAFHLRTPSLRGGGGREAFLPQKVKHIMGGPCLIVKITRGGNGLEKGKCKWQLCLRV